MNKLKKLRARLAKIQEQANAVIATADEEDRDLTAEELEEIEGLKAKADAVRAQISAHQVAHEIDGAVEAAGALSTGRRSDPNPPASSTLDVDDDAEVSGGDTAAAADPNGGFDSFNEYCRAVMHGSLPSAQPDERLRHETFQAAGPTTYGNEAVGSDGGFLVPPGYSSAISELALGEDALLPMTDLDFITGNSLTFPADETTPWGSVGVRAYWGNEGSQATQSKPVVEERSLRLKKLRVLVPLSDEFLTDGAAVGPYVQRKGSEAIRWETNDKLINGPGAGLPFGIKDAPATIVVAKESGQSADTIVIRNLLFIPILCDSAHRHWLS